MGEITPLIWSNLPTERFDIVVLDPPWKYYGSTTKWAAAEKFYRTHDLGTLMTLPIPDLIHKNSCVFMWTTSAQLANSIKLIESWGLCYRGVAFNWMKTNKDGDLFGPTGVRPTTTKPLAEYVIFGSVKPTGKPLPTKSDKVWQTILAPRGKHSEKPEIMQDRLDDLYGPDLTKLEMFARRPRPGWSCWGDEV